MAAVSVGLEVIHRGAGNAVGLLDGRALLFVRSRALTVDALDAIAETIDRIAPRATADWLVGALAIVPGDAGLSRQDLLARQRKIFGAARAMDHVWVSFCVYGESAQTTAMRAVVRLLLLGRSNMKMHAKTEAAIVWFSARLGLRIGDVSDAVEMLRSTA